MDLSAYISFLVKADITDVAAPVFVLTDNSVYPVGVVPTGIFTITQPDGLTRTGSFDSPDIVASNTSKSVNLRLDCNNLLQQGEYTIKYEVHADGYDPTILSRSFTVSYTKPTIVLTNEIDVFTPSIEVQDNTVYSETGYTNTVTRSWSAVIGTAGTLTGTNTGVFDLKYGASYYDAAYTVNFSSIADFQSTSYSFLSIRDSFSKTDSFDVYTPESSAQLLTGLTALKTKLDSLINSCQKYDDAKADYGYAYTLYAHAMKRICAGDKTGVYTYINEITAIINNNVKPILTHTNAPISPYLYDCGSSTAPTVPFTLDVVAGQASAIAAGVIVGATTFENEQLASKYVLVFRGNIKQPLGDPLDGGMFYTKSFLDTTITFSVPIMDGEAIAIYTI
jgi:hypothetical protein